jgi:hypothetical protein
MNKFSHIAPKEKEKETNMKLISNQFFTIYDET